MMYVKVLFVNKVQQYAGETKTILELPDSVDVKYLLQELCGQKPAMKDIVKYLNISVNNVMAPRHRMLQNGDEVILFFRMGGG